MTHNDLWIDKKWSLHHLQNDTSAPFLYGAFFGIFCNLSFIQHDLFLVFLSTEHLWTYTTCAWTKHHIDCWSPWQCAFRAPQMSTFVRCLLNTTHTCHTNNGSAEMEADEKWALWKHHNISVCWINRGNRQNYCHTANVANHKGAICKMLILVSVFYNANAFSWCSYSDWPLTQSMSDSWPGKCIELVLDNLNESQQ